ncbi:MAG TPA: helix-turn-helix domain-containing protein [Burkholderiales bacterium]|nr:helix-turn-helix domain-containing protein [Burkholderiales bacterium]
MPGSADFEDLIDRIATRIAERVAERIPTPPAPIAVPQQPEYLTTRQAAQLLALGVSTLEGWRAQGKGPATIRIGTAIRYSRAAIDAWIGAHARKPK